MLQFIYIREILGTEINYTIFILSNGHDESVLSSFGLINEDKTHVIISKLFI